MLFQVTTLVSSKSPQKKKGKSKRAHVLVAAVERATANFVERGKIISKENPGKKKPLLPSSHLKFHYCFIFQTLSPRCWLRLRRFRRPAS